MQQLLVEIRAAAGGEDAKLLTRDQATIYQKFCDRKGLDSDIVDVRENSVTIKVSGKKAFEAFKDESGIHRFQRVPPTERNGRVHTSTISIAILPIPKFEDIKISEKDIEWTACRGSGAGGQNRNKRDTAVTLHHVPSGIKIRCESQRLQGQNKQIALEMLATKLQISLDQSIINSIDKQRRDQVGLGMRAEKIRTVRLQDDIVVNHLTNKQISAKQYLKGIFDGI